MPGGFLAASIVGEAKHAQRKTVVVGGPAVPDAHEFEAAAAEVGHHAGCVGYGAEDPPRARHRFVGAAQDLDCPSAHSLQMAGEFGPVAGVAHRRGRIGLEPVHPQQRGDIDEPQERLFGKRAARRVQPAGAVQVRAELAGRLVVEERAEAVQPVAIDNQPHGIGADIDNADPARSPRLL